MINGISGSSGYSGPLSQSEIQHLSTGEKRAMIRSGQMECQTCSTRKYQDGSDEMVSFKAPAHISPEQAGAAVRAHEQEHVKNAYNKAAEHGDAQVLNASVSIQTSTCPECGRSYVSGGTTTTQIKYNGDPYGQNSKAMDELTVPGSNTDEKV